LLLSSAVHGTKKGAARRRPLFSYPLELLEAVAERQLHLVVRLQVVREELGELRVERVGRVARDEGAARDTRLREQGPGTYLSRGLNAPALVQQVEEVINPELQRHVLRADRAQRLAE